MLPLKPDAILLASIFARITLLGAIHTRFSLLLIHNWGRYWYWLMCTNAIIARWEMPVPDKDLPRRITDTEGLESCELVIRCADIYLWLAQRREFSQYASSGASCLRAWILR